MYRNKVELHLHLDGSLRPETVHDLLREQSDTNIGIDEVRKRLTISDSDITLVDYLKKFDLPIMLLQTKESLKRASFELVEDLASENTIYAEIRVAPIQHIEKGLTPEEVVSSILEGINKVTEKNNITIGLLLCAMRNRPPEESDFLIELASKFRNKGVVGLDLAGDEAGYPATLFKDFFNKAKSNKIPFTIHAGEAKGPESITEAINLGAMRIGHGIRAYESEEVMNIIVKKGICLECCPISNRDTHAITDFKKYPILYYLKRGIAVTLNSDNRTVSNTNYNKEVEFLKKYLPLEHKHIKEFNLNAIKHSFISDKIKKELISKLNKER